MENLTFEDQPFGRLNLNEIDELEHRYIYYPYDLWNILDVIIEVTLIITSILCSITVIYAIKKFDFLNNRTNAYLLHSSSCVIVMYVINLFRDLCLELRFYRYINDKFMCILHRLDMTVTALFFLFTAGLAIDWFIISLNVSWLDYYGKFQLYIIIIIYLMHLADYIILILPCFGTARIFSGDFAIFVYLGLGGLIILINLFSYFKKFTISDKEYKYALTISSYIMFSWLPLLCVYLIFINLVVYEYDSTYVFVISEVLHSLFKYVIFSLPIATTVWLDSLNSDFRKAYRIIFKIKNSNNEGEILNNEDDGDQSRLLNNDNVLV